MSGDPQFNYPNGEFEGGDTLGSLVDRELRVHTRIAALEASVKTSDSRHPTEIITVAKQYEEWILSEPTR